MAIRWSFLRRNGMGSTSNEFSQVMVLRSAFFSSATIMKAQRDNLMSVMEQLESRVQLSVPQWDMSLLFHVDAQQPAPVASGDRRHVTPMRIRYTPPAGFVHTLGS